jgi:hypothetical protein
VSEDYRVRPELNARSDQDDERRPGQGWDGVRLWWRSPLPGGTVPPCSSDDGSGQRGQNQQGPPRRGESWRGRPAAALYADNARKVQVPPPDNLPRPTDGLSIRASSRPTALPRGLAGPPWARRFLRWSASRPFGLSASRPFGLSALRSRAAAQSCRLALGLLRPATRHFANQFHYSAADAVHSTFGLVALSALEHCASVVSPVLDGPARQVPAREGAYNAQPASATTDCRAARHAHDHWLGSSAKITRPRPCARDEATRKLQRHSDRSPSRDERRKTRPGHRSAGRPTVMAPTP